MSKRLLSFELSHDKNEIEIHANDAGLSFLLEALNQLAANPSDEHIHLMTPKWGGNELSDDLQNTDNTVINHARIFLWSNE